MEEKNRRERNVSVPNFRDEAKDANKRPEGRDYLQGTEWDRSESKEEELLKKQNTIQIPNIRRTKSIDVSDIKPSPREEQGRIRKIDTQSTTKKHVSKSGDVSQSTKKNLAGEKTPKRKPKKVKQTKGNMTKKKVKKQPVSPKKAHKNQGKVRMEAEKKQVPVSANNGKGRAKMSPRKKKIIIKRCCFMAFCCVAVVLGCVAGQLRARLDATLNMRAKSTVDLQEVVVDESKLASDTDIINILIVGVDKRPTWSEAGRSDCVMVGTLDKKHNRLKLTSLMRDMYVDIPNHGKAKFNAAYSYGGVKLLYQTIAYNFDLQLDGYVLVDFAAFLKVIKKIGGVEVTLTEAEANYLIKAYKHGTVTKVVPGKQVLNAKQALAYTRIRQDAAGDFGRTARQRTVMQAIFAKAKSKSSSELLGVAETVMPYITTDLSNDEILDFLTDTIRMGTLEIDQKRIPVDNSYGQQRINNQAVLVPDLDRNKQELKDFIFSYDGQEADSH